MNIMGWADPERDLAVALTNTGKPMPSIDTIRWFEILRRINTRVPRDGPARCVSCAEAPPAFAHVDVPSSLDAHEATRHSA